VAWKKTDTDLCYADGSLHAGITKDSLDNNIKHAHDHSGYIISVGIHDGDVIDYKDNGQKSFVLVNTFNPIILPVHKSSTGAWNTIKVYARCKQSLSGDGNLRMYAMPWFNDGLSVHATNPLPSFTSFDTATINGTSFAQYNWDIVPDQTVDVPDMANETIIGNDRKYQMVYVFPLYRYTIEASCLISIRDIILEEVIA
jgi:hypothetical protein